MMTSQENFTLKRKQGKILLSAPFFSVIRVTQLLRNLQNQDMVKFGK